jgi:DNA-binding NarL/FixJ family response regulator
MKIRVVLADDHQLVRKGFCALLNQEPDIQVIGEAADGRQAMRLVETTDADVLVTDLEMPGMSGLEAARQIKERRLPVRVLVLTMHKETEAVLQVIRAGVAGYIVKDAAVSELVEGIRTVYRGETYLSPAIASRVVTRLLELTAEQAEISPVDRLTEREREIWQLIAEGRQRQEIAELLCISPKTFDTHRANLMRKLDAEDNAALVRLAVRYGIAST